MKDEGLIEILQNDEWTDKQTNIIVGWSIDNQNWFDMKQSASRVRSYESEQLFWALDEQLFIGIDYMYQVLRVRGWLVGVFRL